LDGKPALDSKESYLKVHKTRVKIKEKMANGGMMAMGGEVLKEYEVEFTWDTSDDESRSVYIKANSEDEARRKASDRYKAYKEFKIIKVVDTASPYWHD
jgi:DNA-dependent RNA polymerase auxiliary subunit epsilon